MGGGVLTIGADGKVLGNNAIHVIGPYQVPKGSFPVLKYFEDFKTAQNFILYLNSKTVRFLNYFGICGATLTKEFFRFVPNPNDWSVTYVDSPHPNTTPDEKGYYEYNGVKYCSLYARYKLSAEDISIIESIIKKRS